MQSTNTVLMSSDTLQETKLISLDEELVALYQKQIVNLYKRVFGYSSWNEGYRCSVGCGAKFPLADRPQNLACCGKPVVDFYSEQEVMDMVRDVTGATQYRLLLLVAQENVIGFSWGWSGDLENLNRQKLGLDPSRLDELRQGLVKLLGTMPEVFYYQSETGIDPDSRGQGLSQKLVEGVEQSLSPGTVILQRTSRNSPMFKIRLKNGYSVVFDYNDDDRRVLFCKMLPSTSDNL